MARPGKRRGEFLPPIYPDPDAGETPMWVVNIAENERAVVTQLLGELSAMLTDEDDPSPLLARLFPPAFSDDEEKEAEYQRLMRDELVQSRVVSIEMVTAILAEDAAERIDHGQVMAMMQSVNAVRVVLGTLLDVGEDDEDEPDDSAEHQLYGYLSWLLDWTVRAL